MKTKKRLKRGWRIALWCVAAAALAMLIMIGVLTVKGYRMYQEAVAEKPVSSIMAVIKSRPGVYITREELPEIYYEAVIAAEDRRFETHNGIDPISIARALYVDIRSLSFAEGGSTITQQLAKNELFTQRKHLERKFAEIFAAHAIEECYTKDEIFEMYVNSIYFGSGYYGIFNACNGYFEVPISEMTDFEAVFLAGLPNAPSIYSPDNSPYLATRRMTVVLQRMINYDIISVERADAMMAEMYSLQYILHPENAA